MSQRKINDSLKNLNDSLESLKECFNCKKPENILIDATLYRYQVSYRLLWKSLKRILEFEGYSDLDSPRSIYKLCFSINWISSENDWLDIISINSQIIHAYTDKQLAMNLYYRIKEIYLEIEKLSVRLKKNYAQHAVISNAG